VKKRHSFGKHITACIIPDTHPNVHLVAGERERHIYIALKSPNYRFLTYRHPIWHVTSLDMAGHSNTIVVLVPRVVPFLLLIHKSPLLKEVLYAFHNVAAILLPKS